MRILKIFVIAISVVIVLYIIYGLFIVGGLHLFHYRCKCLVPKNATKGELRSIQSALELYFTDKKQYPRELKTLIDEKYLPEAALKDSFNRYYIYRQAENGKNYKLCSMGKDRKFRTEDDIEAPVIGHSFDDAKNTKQKLREIQSDL